MSLLTKNDTIQTKGGRSSTPGAETPRLAIIGCGAITESFHLPALIPLRSCLSRFVLIDPNEKRLRSVAAKFDVRDWTTDYRTALEDLDGVVIATPPQTHHAITLDCLRSGVHVMCEKPLSASADEAQEMTQEAERQNVTLAVNHTRRLFPMNVEIKQMLRDGTLGPLKKIEYVDGEPFTWSSQTGFHFRPGEHRGVLYDRGIHALDLICWWLGAKPTLISSKNDSYGGPEGVAIINLEHEGCQIKLQLSWLTRLSNTYSLVGQRQSVHGGIEEFNRASMNASNGKHKSLRFQSNIKTYDELGKQLQINFIDVLRGKASPLVAGNDVIHSLQLMEECYRSASRFELPWLQSLEDSHGE